jgi:predicted Holliday junction resolvase-like endonuclease
MEVTLYIIIIFLLFYIISSQKKEIRELREGLNITFDELKQIKKLIENNTFKSSDDAPASNKIVKEIIEEKKIDITPPIIRENRSESLKKKLQKKS